jgi:hypothetical protein
MVFQVLPHPEVKKKLQEQSAQESFRETEAFLQVARARLAREPLLGACPQWLEEELRAALHRDACGLLARLFADRELFPDEAAARPLEKCYAGRPRTVHDRPAESFRESRKLARAGGGLPGFGFQDCRHFFISQAVMAGVDFMTIAKWVGHRDGNGVVE